MKFMVTTGFHADDPSAIGALIPHEKAHVRTLKEEETLHDMYIAADGSRVWMVVEGESPEEIGGILRSFPLYPYMEPEIVALR